MNTRPLDKSESERLKELNEAGLESALLFITETGLRKSILDATALVRDLFLKENWHRYEKQAQGEDNKVMRRATVFHCGKAQEINVSLYRPNTKKGDPRIWPYMLKRYAKPNDVLALFFYDKRLHILNLSAEPLVEFDTKPDDLSRLLAELRGGYDRTANELLQLLREIAACGPTPADGTGDTAIGRTLETALGIKMNASQQPDFKGIELKTKRADSTTRSTLFAKVPNWQISQLKNFKEMLDAFGYEREGRRQLYCTVRSDLPNSQGLLLKLEENFKQLHELHRATGYDAPVCVWELPTLHEKLLTKHRETFWVEGEPVMISGKQHFQFTKVIHTRRPSTIQFDRLLGSGDISVDHLIKAKGNSAHERGPLFKVQRGSRNELFLGAEKIYQLV